MRLYSPVNLTGNVNMIHDDWKVSLGYNIALYNFVYIL